MEEEGAGMPPRRRRSASLHPQIQPSEQGAGVTCRRSPCLHPQIQVPAAPESLPFDDDMLREILIRLPPQPSSLPRASAVCKHWLGLVTDPKFHRQFYAHHRTPPLLGVFSWSNDEGIVFNPIPDPPDRIPPQRFDRIPSGYLLDCRHGRLLVMQDDVLVCDPITGEQHHVVVPSELKRMYLHGAVVCAAGDHGHVHGGCHSSSYKVVLLSTDPSDNQCLARVYSFETGEWSNLSSAETRGYGTPYEMQPFYVEDVPATLVGNCLYWSTGARILEFDLDRESLALIMAPVTNGTSCGSQIIQAADGDVGYAILLYPRLEMWQRNIDGHGDATWVLSKTIEMHTILPPPSPHEEMQVQLLEYDEDDVVFLSCHGSLYMVQLKLMQSKELNEIYSTESRYFSFKSFFTPGSSIPQYDWSQNIYGDDVDLSYGGFTEPEGSNAHQFSAVEDQTCVESPRKKRLRNSKGSDGGSDKSKAKKGKDAVLENLVSVRAEELKDEAN